MGHYDTCRPGYCGTCGQAEGVIWGCGVEGCTKYHEYLKQNRPKDYEALMLKLRLSREEDEERRVTARQISRRVKQLADQAKQEACE